MPTLDAVLRGAPRDPLLPLGFQSWEWQWCYPKGGWAEGQQALMAAFPRAARAERPAPWYASHLVTHGPGAAPPGNGPFFWPEWGGPEGTEERAQWIATLKAAGFRRRRVAVGALPSTREFLIHAMRIAHKQMRWNVDPVLYVVYGYPGRPGDYATLRDYTTGRWTPQGMRAV